MLTVKSFLPALLFSISGCSSIAQEVFKEDFESGLSNRWKLRGARAISIVDGDADHGKVLHLKSEGLVYALIKDGEKWGPIAMSGEFQFPDNSDNYLGFIYNQTEQNGRIDFGSIYIKGNDSYIRVNPFRDGNASRLLYEEYRTPLKDQSKIVTGKWHKFKMEVNGSECHLYVDDMTLPKITFSHYEGNAGTIGFQTRVAGYPVMIDNIQVTKISDLSYQGKPIPDIGYERKNLVTSWEYLGPFERSVIPLEETDIGMKSTVSINGESVSWKTIDTDARGALITARITEYDAGRDIAYFRTKIDLDSDKELTLHISSTEELGLYVNGLFQGFIYRQGYGNKTALDWNAWYDFQTNKEHEGKRVAVSLKKGTNYIMFKSRNGQFASGGFFMGID